VVVWIALSAKEAVPAPGKGLSTGKSTGQKGSLVMEEGSSGHMEMFRPTLKIRVCPPLGATLELVENDGSEACQRQCRKPHEGFSRGTRQWIFVTDVSRMPCLRHLIEGGFIRAVEGGHRESCEKPRPVINEKVAHSSALNIVALGWIKKSPLLLFVTFQEIRLDQVDHPTFLS
jgi:hypothetical protein